MSVYAPMLGTIWRALESYGYEPSEVIDSKLFRPGKCPDLDDRVSFREYDAITTRAAELIDDPTLGLRSAEFLHPSHLGAIGGAWLASSSLRNALRRAERFTNCYNAQIDLSVEELADRVRATYRMREQPGCPDLIGEAQLAGLLKLCRINFGQALVPLEVTLTRTEPEDPSPWNEHFGIPVKFGQPANSLSITVEDADTPLTGSNSELVVIHEQIMHRHLVKLDRENILYRARLIIMEQLPIGRVTEEGTATAMNMSKRTLHRKLRENGETFRSLLTQIRTEHAEHYIRNADYSMTEIAFLLGYTDTSAFSRAFRSWFGRSPTSARQRSEAA